MGSCLTLENTATQSVNMKLQSIINGSEEAANVYSDGLVTSSKVAVQFYCPIDCSCHSSARICHEWTTLVLVILLSSSTVK